MKNSGLATGFITTVAISGIAMLGTSVLKITALHPYQFLCLLLLATVTSRTKVKLPGINGTMSVNLPFLLIAAAQLSLFEAVTVAMVSALLQSIPKRGGQFQPAKILFNASTIGLAAGTAGIALHTDKLIAMQRSGSFALVVACSMFFVINTLPVATIIAITEGSSLVRIWSGIVHLSFPYYVACTGVTSMVTVVSNHIGWQVPLAVLPVMLLIYRCYQRYFLRATDEVKPAAPITRPLSRTAAAH